MRKVSLQYGVPTAFNAVPLVLIEYRAQLEALNAVKALIVSWGNKVVNKNFKPVVDRVLEYKEVMYDPNLFKSEENNWRGVYDKKEFREYLALSEVRGSCRTYLGYVRYGEHQGTPSIQLNTQSSWYGAPSSKYDTRCYHSRNLVSDWELTLVTTLTESKQHRLDVEGSIQAIDKRIEQTIADMAKYVVLEDMDSDSRLSFFVDKVNTINTLVKSIEDTIDDIPYYCRGDIKVD
jgi:hypothetical protein